MKKSLRGSIIAFRRLAVRLARDTAGNTLAIVAAAIIPLAALVGSGIDMSRAYMAQARLQMACDAASLAGRRAMTTGAVDATVRSEALKFFRFNFETGETGKTPAFNVASFIPTVNDGTNSAVVVAASTTVPTTLMSMFGYTNVPISVTCSAKQDYVNTDIVLVLDTTGSMGSKAVYTDTQTKIEGLRSAVLALYDQLAPVQTQLQGIGLRLRYAVVPYSTAVNAGEAIRAVNPNYLVSSWDYQSRKALFDTPIYTAHPGTPSTVQETSYAYDTRNKCKGWANADTDSTGTAPSPVTTVTYSYVSFSGGSDKCVRNVTTLTTTYTSGGGYSFTRWIYKQAEFNVSNFKTDSSITIATNTSGVMPVAGEYTQQEMVTSGSGFSTNSYSWDGCVEERKTVSTITSSATSIPSNAYDLDIDLIPHNDDTRWAPIWDNIKFRRNNTGDTDPTVDAFSGSSISAACPTAAKRLQAWTRTDMNSYLNSLNASGNTYHDIGMIWGARFLSSDGIFAADNPATYNNMPVARYIIFMTDGILQPSATVYSSYGIEYLDRRVTGGYTNSTDLENRHAKRFSLVCESARAKGASVWVIAFASSLSTELSGCASNSSQASVSTNSAELIAKFAQIGREIGALRLTK
ncbi:MAG: pilus assembly protein TadG-related protein [Sphingomonadaceae bacterium]